MRNYGRFTTTIYRDEDFRALTLAEQAVYFMLGLQPEVTAAGTLPLTLRRWANMAEGLTRDDLAETLSVLAEHGHILVDWDTEELLIVKFVKWDGGINNDKRRPVIREAALAIESKPIRHRLAHEIAKLGYADMASAFSVEGASEAQSGFDRVVVTEGESVPNPQTATTNPSSATPEGEPLGDAEPSPFCSKHPNGTEKSCGPCGTAKLRWTRWAKSQPAREAAAKRDAQSLRQNCPDCHGDVWLEDGTKCTHANARVAS